VQLQLLIFKRGYLEDSIDKTCRKQPSSNTLFTRSQIKSRTTFQNYQHVCFPNNNL